MANSWFQFKQFRINQDRCAMKVSSDAVLLGALAEKEKATLILDVGAGTGVVSLMLAQRFPEAKAIGVELDFEAAGQCKENYEASPFSGRLAVEQVPFQKFVSDLEFDLIVSNPPFFPSHLKPENDQRKKALHTDFLPFGDLVKGAIKYLKPEGKFWVILPPDQMREFRKIGDFFKLQANRTFEISDRPGKRILREIVCFSFHKEEITKTRLYYKAEKGDLHKEYKALLSDFFLHF